jgi:hypothetical protein
MVIFLNRSIYQLFTGFSPNCFLNLFRIKWLPNQLIFFSHFNELIIYVTINSSSNSVILCANHFVNRPFCQLAILSTGHFVNSILWTLLPVKCMHKMTFGKMASCQNDRLTNWRVTKTLVEIKNLEISFVSLKWGLYYITYYGRNFQIFIIS